MVYKYQEETIEQLKEIVGKLEDLTEDKMSLKIGIMRIRKCPLDRPCYDVIGNLFLNINKNEYFTVSGDGLHEDYSTIYSDLYVKFDEDIFLKINELIDKIYKNKHEREQFHEKLNKELNALNKAL